MKHQGQTMSETMSMLSLAGLSMSLPCRVASSGFSYPQRHVNLGYDVIVSLLRRHRRGLVDLLALHLPQPRLVKIVLDVRELEIHPEIQAERRVGSTECL